MNSEIKKRASTTPIPAGLAAKSPRAFGQTSPKAQPKAKVVSGPKKLPQKAQKVQEVEEEEFEEETETQALPDLAMDVGAPETVAAMEPYQLEVRMHDTTPVAVEDRVPWFWTYQKSLEELQGLTFFGKPYLQQHWKVDKANSFITCIDCEDANGTVYRCALGNTVLTL
jgi:hypothetical protein